MDGHSNTVPVVDKLAFAPSPYMYRGGVPLSQHCVRWHLGGRAEEQQGVILWTRIHLTNHENITANPTRTSTRTAPTSVVRLPRAQPANIPVPPDQSNDPPSYIDTPL